MASPASSIVPDCPYRILSQATGSGSAISQNGSSHVSRRIEVDAISFCHGREVRWREGFVVRGGGSCVEIEGPDGG